MPICKNKITISKKNSYNYLSIAFLVKFCLVKMSLNFYCINRIFVKRFSASYLCTRSYTYEKIVIEFE